MIKKFEKTFEDLSQKHGHDKIFDGLLDYIINGHLLNNDNPDWNYNFNKKELEKLYELYKNLILITNSELENKKWYDFLGEFYQINVLPRSKASNNGQFFTPSHIVDFMVEMVCFNLEKQQKINDPCCGSGRMLLSAHSKFPGNYVFGSDLDLQACKMSIVNFLVHGCVGSVIWMNSLSMEFFGGWKINEYLNHGLPIPHIQRVNSLNEAYNFLYLNWDETEEIKVLDNIIPAKTVQTTLM